MSVCVTGMLCSTGFRLFKNLTLWPFVFFSLNRMKPRKVKEDDAPRTIACPHKVSLMTLSPEELCHHFAQTKLNSLIVLLSV